MASDNTTKTAQSFKGVSAEAGVQSAGDVKVEVLIAPALGGEGVDVRQFVGEINIFEDMFKNGLYGNILIIDAANIAALLPIVGDEYITIRIITPGIQNKIDRTFKVYSLSDRRMIRDTNTQSFVLHFCSPELFIDLLSPLYATYRGRVTDIVQQIWNESVAVDRPLTVVGEASNEITFTSPGWSALHCLNWLAARAIPADVKSPSFLLYESNKSFYFANIETVIKNSIDSNSIFSNYRYQANNLTQNSGQPGFVKDIDSEYRKVEDFQIVETFNAFKNNQNGYYSNRLITFDIQTKKYEIFDYDHVSSYDEYQHLENIGQRGSTNIAPFKADTLRNPAGYVYFYPKHENLYNNVKDNANDVIENVLPRRLSTVQELGNFKLIITVPGRADMEVGAIIRFSYPDNRPRDESDKNKAGEDDYYTGYYLVTAVRHKVTLMKHMMILEIVKDSFHKEP